MPEISMPGADKQEKSTVGLTSGKGPDSTGVEKEERPEWGNEWEGLLTLIGYAVGIGNVWRFPYLCFENGGAVFLVPYMIVLIFLGIPIFALESAAGQSYKQGSLQIWGTINPYLSGVGVASLFCTWLVALYYNVLIAWALYYFGASFMNPLPWTVETSSNGTVTMDAKMYFEDTVLGMSPSINEGGDMQWELWLCFTVAWLMVFGIICKGIESAGKVVYFTATFPYLVLLIMVIRGVSLPNASLGLEFYLVPKWEELGNASIWVKAGEQVFYSLGVGWGSIITFGSFNKRDHDFISDSLFVPFVNAFTSFFAGFAVFGTAGYLAHEQGVEVGDLNLSGSGLAFILYPTALAEMDGGNIFAILFFFMLLLLGIDSQFAMTETVVTAIVDSGHLPQWIVTKENKWKVTAITCFFCYIVGFVFIGESGIYYLNVINGLSVGGTLFAVGALECFAITGILGADNFVEICKRMLGPEKSIKYDMVLKFYTICWKYISPVFLVCLFFTSFIVVFTENYDSYICASAAEVGDEHALCPDARWGVNMGRVLSCIGIMMIPSVALYAYFQDGKKVMRDSSYQVRRGSAAAVEVEFTSAEEDPVNNPAL